MVCGYILASKTGSGLDLIFRQEWVLSKLGVVQERSQDRRADGVQWQARERQRSAGQSALKASKLKSY
jgi:hypothetical protein